MKLRPEDVYDDGVFVTKEQFQKHVEAIEDLAAEFETRPDTDVEMTFASLGGAGLNGFGEDHPTVARYRGEVFVNSRRLSGLERTRYDSSGATSYYD